MPLHSGFITRVDVLVWFPLFLSLFSELKSYENFVKHNHLNVNDYFVNT